MTMSDKPVPASIECQSEIDKDLVRSYYGDIEAFYRVRAALAATPAVGGEAKPIDITGWKLVPDAPTEEMWQAGRSADIHPGDSYSKVWRAMFNAAPNVDDCETTSTTAQPASPLRGREIELRAALERSVIAIDDWLQTYAADLCDPARVEEASKRIGEYGTLSYIAHVQQQNRDALSASPPEQPADPLSDLVSGFAKALLAKLRLASANGRSGWERDDWEKQCQQGLLRHLEKGDPRDVAAYCAFMWHHGWITAPPELPDVHRGKTER